MTVIAIGTLLLIMILPYLIGALREGHQEGRLKAPRIGRRQSSSFSPTFPVQGGKENDIEIDF